MLLKDKGDEKVIGLFTKLLIDESNEYIIHSSVITSLQKLVLNRVFGHDSMVHAIDKCLAHELPVVIKQVFIIVTWALF